jgi:hypothetical protein
MSVEDEDAAETLSVRGTDDIFHGRDHGTDAQAERAGVFRKIWRDAEIQGRRNQHPGPGGSGIRQGEGNLDISQQAEIGMLLARAKDEHQAVILREVFFHIHPVQIFKAHDVSKN